MTPTIPQVDDALWERAHEVYRKLETIGYSPTCGATRFGRGEGEIPALWARLQAALQEGEVIVVLAEYGDGSFTHGYQIDNLEDLTDVITKTPDLGNVYLLYFRAVRPVISV